MPKKCKDHLGNEYRSISAMCKHYGIARTAYTSRIENGASIEEALTSPNKFRTKDHLGNEYASESEMCRHYNIERNVYKSRIAHGASIEEALTRPVKDIKSKVKDHLGNEYVSINDMCKHYGISKSAYDGRKARGFTLEEILTTPVKDVKSKIRDHLGNEYKSISAMARAYGLKSVTLTGRLKSGMSIQDALTAPVQSHPTSKCKDHLGNDFESEAAMCRYHGVNVGTYFDRKSHGWPLKKCLEPTNQHQYSVEYQGHSYNIEELVKVTGVPRERLVRGVKKNKTVEEIINEYENYKKQRIIYDPLTKKEGTISEIAREHGIKPGTLQNRLSKGIDITTALTTEVKNTNYECSDHLGNRYANEGEMSKAYGISLGTFKGRIRSGKTLEEALTGNFEGAIASAGYESPYYKECYDHLGNRYENRTERAKTYGLNINTIQGRLDRGWTLEKALTTPSSEQKIVKTKCKDHLGNEYPSVSKMCEAYGIKLSTYTQRRKYGIGLEDSLTSPNMKLRKDHLGKEYKSLKEMLAAYNIPHSTFQQRIKMGWTLKNALTVPATLNHTECTDHLGNTYSSRTEMCKAYHLEVKQVENRLRRGWTIEEALRIPFNMPELFAYGKTMFQMDNEDYYGWECPMCKTQYVFTKKEIRKHILMHLDNNNSKKEISK